MTGRPGTPEHGTGPGAPGGASDTTSSTSSTARGETADGTQPTIDPPETTMTDQQTPDEPSSRPDPTLSTQLGWPETSGSAPAAAPFRVEPVMPVPDDATNPDDLGPGATDPVLPHLPPPSGPAAYPGPVSVGHPAPTPPARPLVTVRKGPRPGTVVLGLLSMLVSAYVLVGNLTDADLSLRLVGPPLVGAFGGVLLLVGLAGVVAARLRR